MIKRLVSTANLESCLNAADTYVQQLGKSDHDYLYLKPYDRSPFNKQYFAQIYSVLNLIEAMHLKPNARILEVGSGSGWVTEILAALGHSICALEPCVDFINISKQKLLTLSAHIRRDITTDVEFCNECLENSNLDEESYDAVLFIASLHHVVDEVACAKKCYKYLKPGGILGVVQEESYNPLSPLSMRIYEEEKLRTGVLESPFTKEYLDALLLEAGFSNIVRYQQANGLFPVGQEVIPNLLCGDNTLTAIKPYQEKTTMDPEAIAKVLIEMQDISISENMVCISARIKNIGECIWLHNPATRKGYVTIALREGEPGSSGFREAANRINLPCDMLPNQQFTIKAVFQMDSPTNVQLDLVNEGYFWFSTRSNIASSSAIVHP